MTQRPATFAILQFVRDAFHKQTPHLLVKRKTPRRHPFDDWGKRAQGQFSVTIALLSVIELAEERRLKERYTEMMGTG